MLIVLKDLYTRHSIYPPDYFEKVKEAQQLYLVCKMHFSFLIWWIEIYIFISFGALSEILTTNDEYRIYLLQNLVIFGGSLESP